jgi:hypothetical protein
VPQYRPPCTAPPTTKWWLPQPWSLPSPLLVSVRPKSLAVKLVTCAATPSSAVASWKAFIASATVAINPGCSFSRKSCVSKPPMDTKNTCRLAPSALRAAIILATIASWSARVLPAGNTVLSAGTPANAEVSAALASMARAMTRVCSACIRWLRLAVVRLRSASLQAVEPNSGALMPRKATEPVGATWYCTACCPLMYTALPLTFTQVKVAWLFDDRNKSPMRPPQPEVEPSGSELCQTDCWSLCENSLGGSGTLLALYCASVVGCMSVPTFSSTAMRPASNSVFSGASSGASAIWRAFGRATLGVSAVAAKVSRGSARVWRMVL